MTIVWTLGSVAIVSLISLVGIIALSIRAGLIHRVLTVLVAIAAGTLIGDAFLHLLPHYAEEFGFTVQTGLLVLAGIVMLFVIERFIHWHHCHDPHMCEDPHDPKVEHEGHVHPFGWSILIGDGLHNLLDGALIAAGYLVSVPVGMATTIAVALHEIPQEIADFGVLLHAGFSRTKALMVNFGSALTAFIGAGFVLLFSEAEILEQFLIPITAGAFIYIATADLLPELTDDSRAKIAVHFVGFLAGIGLMALLLLL